MRRSDRMGEAGRKLRGAAGAGALALAAALAGGGCRETGGPVREVEPARPEAREVDREADAVERGLRWLAFHQDPDGHWSAGGYPARCRGPRRCAGEGPPDHDLGITALAALAFLRAGYLPGTAHEVEDPFGEGRTVRFSDAVGGSLRWLLDRQDAAGSFHPQMYAHAIATLAVAEAAWLGRRPEHRAAARRAVAYLLDARNPDSAWRYAYRSGDNDTSITGWCVLALAAGDAAGIPVDAAARKGVEAWLRAVTIPDGRVGYDSAERFTSSISGLNDAWDPHPTMTAVALACRIALQGARSDPWRRRAADIILRDRPARGPTAVDSYYWHYANLALWWHDGPRGPAWTAYRAAVREAILGSQVPAAGGDGAPRCDGGSWGPGPDKWGQVGGRVYTTALNVLTLEVERRPPAATRDPAPAAGGKKKAAAPPSTGVKAKKTDG